MPFAARPVIPATPRVISPSPTPSERDHASSQESSYFGPTTRSASRRKRLATPGPNTVPENAGEDARDGMQRARTRSRSPLAMAKVNGLTPLTTEPAAVEISPAPNGKAGGTNGHLLSPNSAHPESSGWSWRDFSRSPSPLGLIPIHRHWRTFVHKHEVPRKLLHTSIGFLVMWLYASGTQTAAVCPWLMGLLVPIATVDYVRHAHEPFNRFYVRYMGAFMRESEFAGWNGVIFYLLGAWIVLYAFPKDVGTMGVLLLSWCDTAASTFGRLYGRYTPRLRRGKSLAGSTAACFVGVATAAAFWGWLVPRFGPQAGDEDFMFKGTLSLPVALVDAVGWKGAPVATVSGGVALAILGAWSGFTAAASEVVDVFGWDDNLTIPVISGVGIWGFLKVFG
ncbi:unnamed protein product [Discula destructiva]